MKKILTTVIIGLCTIFILSAQFDDRFYFPSKEWNTIENMEFKEFKFNIENETLSTILFMPKRNPKATILFYHGAGGNISTYTFIVEPLVKAGFQVFAVDFRGYGKSTGTPTHIHIAQDAQIIFNQFIEMDAFINLPVIIYGASMGTQIATKIAKDNQSKVDGLILDGTISSFTDMALLSAPEEQKQVITQYVVSPYSAKKDIKEIKNMPKLFIHSKGDKTVPFLQGQIVFENASQPKEFWIYEGDHLESATKYPEILIQKMNTITNSFSKSKK